MLNNMLRNICERLKHVWISTLFLTLFVILICVSVVMLLIGNLEVRSGLAIISVLLGIAGWTANNVQSKFSDRRQHTLNILLETRFSETWNTKRKMIDAYSRPGQAIDPSFLLESQNNEVREAAKFIGNYYEFLGAAIRYGDLDEPLLRSCIRSQACGFYRRFGKYVYKIRDVTQNENLYIEFESLYLKWRRNDEYIY